MFLNLRLLDIIILLRYNFPMPSFIPVITYGHHPQISRVAAKRSAGTSQAVLLLDEISKLRGRIPLVRGRTCVSQG